MVTILIFFFSLFPDRTLKFVSLCLTACSRVISNPSLWPHGRTHSTEHAQWLLQVSVPSTSGLNVLCACMVAVVYVLKLSITKILINDDIKLILQRSRSAAWYIIRISQEIEMAQNFMMKIGMY